MLQLLYSILRCCMQAATDDRETNGHWGRGQEGDLEAPELPSFHGCTVCTAIRAAIPSERNPETRGVIPTHPANEKIPTSTLVRRKDEHSP